MAGKDLNRIGWEICNSKSNGIPEIIGSLEYDQNLSLGGFILPHLVGIEVTRDSSKIPR